MGEFLVISAVLAGGCAALVTALARFHEGALAFVAEDSTPSGLSPAVLAVRTEFEEQHRALAAACSEGRRLQAAAYATLIVRQRTAVIAAVRQRGRTYGVRPTTAVRPGSFRSRRLRILAVVGVVAHELAWTPGQRLALRLRLVSIGLAAARREFARLGLSAYGRGLDTARAELEASTAALVDAMVAVENK